jgi:hypothetical protein
LAYIVGEDKKVTIQSVTIALTQGNVAVIASGLQEGQQVVTEGQDKLQTGSVVAPKNPTAPQGGAPANALEAPQVKPPNPKIDSTSYKPRKAENLGGVR